MAQNTINNRSSTLTVDNNMVVSAGGANIAGNTTINGSSISIGADATTNAINIGTNGSKVITMGSTTGASTMQIDTGDAGFNLDSPTGSLMNMRESGTASFDNNPRFLARLNTENNVTGDSTPHNCGTVTAATEIFDVGSNFDPGGGGNPAQFVASVDGVYFFSFTANVSIDATNGGSDMLIFAGATPGPPRTYVGPTRNRVTNFFGVNGELGFTGSSIMELDVSDLILTFFNSRLATGTPDDFISGWFSGYLVG